MHQPNAFMPLSGTGRSERLAALGLPPFVDGFLLRSLCDLLLLCLQLTENGSFLLLLGCFLTLVLALHELLTKLEDLLFRIIVLNAVGKLISRCYLGGIYFLNHCLKLLQIHLSVVRNNEDLMDTRR